MNSEELEKSLRTEFESYLKDTLADMRQEVFQLQYKIDSELEKYKAQIDEIFKEFSEKAKEDYQIGENFQDAIVEHLRLARDDGATITAQAIAEAEKLEKKMSPGSLDATGLRDAVNEISSQTSQASILKSLIDHAEKFVPRGAFFVVKNQNFVGWRVFGSENPSGDDDIREIYFETSRATVLNESVNSLHTVESSYGSFEEDSVFLDPLNFGEPERMYVVPLVARGRGVAAVYADAGEAGNDLNVAALETLVRTAGLTVELLAAAAHTATSRPATAPAPAESSYTPTQSQAFAETTPEPVEEVAEANEAESYETVEESTATYESIEAEEVADTETAEEETEFVSGEEETEEVYEAADEGEIEPESEEAESYEESYETAPAIDYEEYSADEVDSDASETEFDYETVAPESVEETAALEADTADEAEFETVDAEDETYPVSDQAETSTDYEISAEYEPEAVQKPAEPFDQPMSEEFDTNEYLADEAHSESLTDDFVSDDDSIEEIQASEEPVEQPAETDAVEFQDSSETEEAGFAESADEEPSLGEEAAEDMEIVEDPITVESSKAEEQEEAVAAAAPPPPPPVKSRLAGRNVDLPIEVSEEERKLHNDARRFARLLVSEIKLYNEQKVIEGRSSGDLYDRLQEAIDRSREMYDKRVQPPVAERFDYFHYEVVNTLGEGEESKLGSKYPGATV